MQIKIKINIKFEIGKTRLLLWFTRKKIVVELKINIFLDNMINKHLKTSIENILKTL